MNSLHIEFRAIDIDHSCYPDEINEQIEYSEYFKNVLSAVIKILDNMSFDGVIESEKNSYQMNINFDAIFFKKMRNTGWHSISTEDIWDSHKVSKMVPDAIMAKDNTTLVIEIEKSNKWTIWFDFMKIFRINEDIANFGILIVPRNWPHSNGVYDLFKEARKYLWYINRYGKTEDKILSKIAIIGYTQEVYWNNKWQEWTKSIQIQIKEKAINELKKRRNNEIVR